MLSVFGRLTTFKRRSENLEDYVFEISLPTAILKTDNPLQIIVPVGKNKMAADQVSYRAKLHRKARFLVHVKDF